MPGTTRRKRGERKSEHLGMTRELETPLSPKISRGRWTEGSKEKEKKMHGSCHCEQTFLDEIFIYSSMQTYQYNTGSKLEIKLREWVVRFHSGGGGLTKRRSAKVIARPSVVREMVRK